MFIEAGVSPGSNEQGKEISMRPMFLSEVEQRNPAGAYDRLINELREAGHPVPQIMHLFAYKPEQTDFLSRYTQSVMRGPSPLPPGFRELIAAFTSRRNDCLF
jgi:alkylhydroperoxidase family enzyme